MRETSFTSSAYKQFENWKTADKKIYSKIVELLKAIEQDPFDGIGKPESLKHFIKGCWSRRITKEHRLVYQVTKDKIIIISCKFHY